MELSRRQFIKLTIGLLAVPSTFFSTDGLRITDTPYKRSTELERIAIELGRRTGLSAEVAIEQFQMMLHRNSLPYCDLFNLSTGNIRSRFNELFSQHTTGDGYQRELRAQCFMAAVMEEAERNL